jgi:menaquinone-dependent protoporphyrinogen oxidase
MARILVLYGTTDGHTTRIAEAVADTLRAHGARADVMHASRPGPKPDDYDGILIAASVHGGRFQRDVRRWVSANEHLFKHKPTGFISVCLGVLQHDPDVQREEQAIVNRFLVETGWRPTMTKIVAGALLYRRYGWIKRWVMKRIAAKAGGDTDTSRNYVYTDWTDLRAFAAQFGGLVSPAGHMVMGMDVRGIQVA